MQTGPKQSLQTWLPQKAQLCGLCFSEVSFFQWGWPRIHLGTPRDYGEEMDRSLSLSLSRSSRALTASSLQS